MLRKVKRQASQGLPVRSLGYVWFGHTHMRALRA